MRSSSGVSIAAALVLAAFAVAAVLVVASRAAAGIAGRSVRHRRIIGSAWGTGYLILLVAGPAVSSSVSTRTDALISFAGPVVLAGLTYLLAAALGRHRSALALGAWLVIVGAGCAWLAPATILAAGALAGGGAFLLMAVIETRLRAHDR